MRNLYAEIFIQLLGIVATEPVLAQSESEIGRMPPEFEIRFAPSAMPAQT